MSTPYNDAELLQEVIDRTDDRQAKTIAANQRGNFYDGQILHHLRCALNMVALRDAEEKRAARAKVAGSPEMIIDLAGNRCIACKWHGPYLMEPCPAHTAPALCVPEGVQP